jgi:DNA-binding transcriptional MerR regulator
VVFRIGEFSRIARVSCRLLRYYDELGLLQPAHTQGGSGYRFYSAAQLTQLNRILVLRDLGLSLEQIARLLEAAPPAAQLRGMLQDKRRELAQSIAEQTEQLRRIESRLSQIETEGAPLADDVVLRAEPARELLAIRQTLPSFKEGVQLVGELASAIPRAVDPSQLDQFVVIAHAPEFEPDRLDVELGFFLREPGAARVQLPNGLVLEQRTVPALARVAACVRQGLPDEAHASMARIGHFLERNGYRVAGPSREVFLERPRADRMRDGVVEMQYPIEPV